MKWNQDHFDDPISYHRWTKITDVVPRTIFDRSREENIPGRNWILLFVKDAPVNVESSSVSKVSTVKEVQILSNALYKKINFPVSVVYINLYRLLVILSIRLFVSVSLWWGLQRIDTTDILVVSQGIVSRTYTKHDHGERKIFKIEYLE